MHVLLLLAAAPPAPPPSVNSTLFVALAVSAVCSWAIPPVVDLVTKSHFPTELKTLLALALSVVAGVWPTVVFVPGEKLQDYVLAVGVALANSQGAHRILLGLGDPIQNSRLGKLGIGPAEPAQPEEQPEPDPSVVDAEDPPADAPDPPDPLMTRSALPPSGGEEGEMPRTDAGDTEFLKSRAGRAAVREAGGTP